MVDAPLVSAAAAPLLFSMDPDPTGTFPNALRSFQKFTAVTVWYSDAQRVSGAERGAARALLDAQQDACRAP